MWGQDTVLWAMGWVPGQQWGARPWVSGWRRAMAAPGLALLAIQVGFRFTTTFQMALTQGFKPTLPSLPLALLRLFTLAITRCSPHVCGK